MSTDSGVLEPPEPRPAQDLPQVTDLRARRVRFEPPERRNFPSALPRLDSTVEFLVETDAPIPARALAPVLYVGDTPASEVTADDATHYRFVTLQPDALEDGAPISLGWSGRPPAERAETAYRFEDPGEISEDSFPQPLRS
jgi:hypothetical protein